MSFIARLLSGLLSGPRAWIVLIIIVFIGLLLVYRSLVSPSLNPSSYQLPLTIDSSTLTAAPEDLVAPPYVVTTDKKTETEDRALVSTNPLDIIEKPPAGIPAIDYEIKAGDTLAGIFTSLGLPVNDLYGVLEADQEYLVLEPLMPGDTFIFALDEKGELASLTRRLDVSKSVSYVRHDNGGFNYEETIKPITYLSEALHTTIQNNFYLSAKSIGLSDGNILIVNDLLKGRVNFRKDLRAGDAFNVIIKKGTVEGVDVGKSQVEALDITVRGQTYSAFLHSDGRYYDADANSLTAALLRWPTRKPFRISSSFNANRLHPITGGKSPHNGVDLATPSGTELVATGDGVVTRVATHKYAGKYIVLDYTGPYGSRYLHLSKVLVKNGQRVKRGQVIALSGNTGRTTGAHLHYELHIKGKPVNPMTTSIPTSQSIAKEERQAFVANVAEWSKQLRSDVSDVLQ
ncbi:peptidoglycan DD-metalloendopeptidase family protein [Marinomonas sp. IMCC 4694]|uniref:peptidoglycan DD-metalloendopeptidase family protein n=1 Tax=Marinomonas sp. IMCC 4694 TaxID=2605432 RepID=UPI0011E84C6E|nr:peptidoglycan DD-metalloendopeptidase family protein [Marinomonas sp. IMCC 4694]TYL47493.1 peptidoglycan DD-metalloendopeptidase family protein [Marinomonas sp. IMCC 4694]